MRELDVDERSRRPNLSFIPSLFLPHRGLRAWQGPFSKLLISILLAKYYETVKRYQVADYRLRNNCKHAGKIKASHSSNLPLFSISSGHELRRL